MIKSEKERETVAIMAAIIFHLLILLFIPGFKPEIIKPIINQNIMTISANFVEVIVPNITQSIPKQTEKQSEKNVQIIKETKRAEVPKKVKAIEVSEKKNQERVKFSEEMLPKISINREKIKFEDYSVKVQNNKATLSDDIKIKDEIGSKKSQDISLRDSDGKNDGKDKKEQKLVDINENINSGGEKQVSLIKGSSDGNGISSITAPSGVVLQVVDGDGEALWDKSNKEPEYPEKAQLNGWTGKVVLLVTVDSQGIVKNVVIEEKSGHYEIDRATEKAAKSWKIHRVKKGIRIAGKVRIPYIFDLRK